MTLSGVRLVVDVVAVDTEEDVEGGDGPARSRGKVRDHTAHDDEGAPLDPGTAGGCNEREVGERGVGAVSGCERVRLSLVVLPAGGQRWLLVNVGKEGCDETCAYP